MVAALLEFLEKMPQQYVFGVQLPGGNVMAGDGDDDHGRASAFPGGTVARAAWEDNAAERKLLADGFELLLARTGAAAAVRRAGLAEVHETIEKILAETVFQLRARRDWQHHAQRWEQQPVKKSKNKRKKVAATRRGFANGNSVALRCGNSVAFRHVLVPPPGRNVPHSNNDFFF